MYCRVWQPVKNGDVSPCLYGQDLKAFIVEVDKLTSSRIKKIQQNLKNKHL